MTELVNKDVNKTAVITIFYMHHNMEENIKKTQIELLEMKKKKKSEVENTLENKTRLDTAAEKINEHEDSNRN